MWCETCKPPLSPSPPTPTPGFPRQEVAAALRRVLPGPSSSSLHSTRIIQQSGFVLFCFETWCQVPDMFPAVHSSLVGLCCLISPSPRWWLAWPLLALLSHSVWPHCISHTSCVHASRDPTCLECSLQGLQVSCSPPPPHAACDHRWAQVLRGHWEACGIPSYLHCRHTLLVDTQYRALPAP